MPLREILTELEQPPLGCDMLDMDKLLQNCGYAVTVDEGVKFYHKPRWRPWTFGAHHTRVSAEKAREITEHVRYMATLEGLL